MTNEGIANPDNIRSGDVFEVTIEKIVYGGDGLARLGPAVILVPFTAPGERVRVRIVSTAKRLLRGTVEELVTRSEKRVSPACPHFGICGGCQLQHLDNQTQIETRVGFIRESLYRISGIDWKGEIRVIAGPSTGYRARAELKIDRDDDRQPHLGYFESGTHQLCEIETCPILHPALERELHRQREHPEAIPPAATRLYLSTGDNGTFAVPATGEDGQRAATDALRTVHQRVLGIDYTFGARSFFQGNLLLIEKLVTEAISDVSGDRAIDLYAGVGLFSLQLAGRFKKVCAVEGNPVAARHAAQNCKINNISNVEFHSRSVESWLKHQSIEWKRPDLVLLDPPRAGAGTQVCAKIAALSPETIRYVSCDPTTLARDLGHLIDAGYSISQFAMVDMFPQTYHVESIVTLRPAHRRSALVT
ncbi:MAG: class I SAM-dependent RNA methyltransferase [Blastocatellia bacterium]